MAAQDWNKLPVSVGRIPVFLPRRRRQIEEKVFQTSWGTVTVTGQTLTTYDEDIFMAVINNGKRRLYTSDEGDVLDTIVFEGTLYSLSKVALKKRGGTTYRKIEDSIAALKSVNINISSREISFHDSLVYQVMLSKDSDHKKVKIVMNAKIAKAFQKSRHINLIIRKKLSPTEKALHRFLSMHGKHFRCGFEKLHMSIYPMSRKDNFRHELLRGLKKLKELDFLNDFKVEGDIVVTERNMTRVVVASEGTISGRNSETSGICRGNSLRTIAEQSFGEPIEINRNS